MMKPKQQSTTDLPSFREVFAESLAADFPDLCDGKRNIAVAVSGGPDSMALCHALSVFFSEFPDVRIYALTVDHGLRKESADEAEQVGLVLQALDNVEHHILKWKHEEKPQTRIQEQAREARYKLMQEAMVEQGVEHLFLGHHMDDQAETFLFRLSKGSGLDGLACMTPRHDSEDGVTLCRPFLDMTKDGLVAYCQEEGVAYVEDPSNESEDFARVRIRNSMAVLSEEGLTSKRLRVTAYRLARARSALEGLSEKLHKDSILKIDKSRIVFNIESLRGSHEELVLRVVLQAMSHFQTEKEYGARLERVERVCSDLMKKQPFRKRTLGGVIFDVDDKKGTLSLIREKAA